MGLPLLQISSQAFQYNFVSFGNGYKYALPSGDSNDFGCTIPNGRYQVRPGSVLIECMCNCSRPRVRTSSGHCAASGSRSSVMSEVRRLRERVLHTFYVSYCTETAFLV